MLPVINKQKACVTDQDCPLTQKCRENKATGKNFCFTFISCPTKKKEISKNYFFDKSEKKSI
jgi:hypothetical protein